MALLRQRPQRARKCRAVMGSVAAVAVDEVMGLACYFLPHHFHAHLLRWTATCQSASGHYGVSCIPRVAVSSSIWKSTVAAAVILYLYVTVHRKRSWGQEPDISYVRCKNQH